MRKLIIVLFLLLTNISFGQSEFFWLAYPENKEIPIEASFAPTIVSQITTTATGVSNFDATLPSSLVNDDLLIAIVGSSYDGTAVNHIKDVTGWVQHVEIVDASSVSGTRSAIFTRIVDGTEGATQNFTFGSTRNFIITIVHVTGNATTSPLEVLGTSYEAGSQASHIITGVTTSTDNSLAFYSFSYDENATGLPYTPSGTGWTETLATEITAIGLSFGTKEMPTAGATGSVTITPSRSDGANGIVFNIKQ